MQIILIIILVIGVILIIRWMSSIILKLIGIAIILMIFSYLFLDWHPFPQDFNSESTFLEKIEKKYCNEKEESTICECVVEPLMEELRDKYSPEEMKNLQKNKIQFIEAVTEIIENKKDDFKDCLGDSDEWRKVQNFSKIFFED